MTAAGTRGFGQCPCGHRPQPPAERRGGEGGRSAETGELAELLGNEKEVRERERRVFTQQDPEDLGLSEKLLRDNEQHLRIGPAALQTSRWAAR